MEKKKISGYEDLTAKEKFMDIVVAFKLAYNTASGKKKLTNEHLASFLGIKREHFQKLMSSEEGIDIAKVENLVARYIVWHYATKFGIDPEAALEPAKVWQLLLEKTEGINEKSGTSAPDYLPTLRKQLSTALVSLQEAMKTLPQPMGPEISAAGDPAFRQSGKTKRTERQ